MITLRHEIVHLKMFPILYLFYGAKPATTSRYITLHDTEYLHIAQLTPTHIITQYRADTVSIRSCPQLIVGLPGVPGGRFASQAWALEKIGLDYLGMFS